MILSVETSGITCGVAISDDGNLISSFNIFEKNIHDKALASLTLDILKYSKLEIDDIKAISINAGPGSFTGLRIGAAFIKGLMFGSQIKLIPLTSHDLIFNNFIPNNFKKDFTFAIVLIKSNYNNYYYKKYDLNLMDCHSDLMIKTRDDIIAEITDDKILLGNGAKDFECYNKLDTYDNLKAEWQVQLANKQYLEHNFSNASEFNPLYLNEVNIKTKIN